MRTDFGGATARRSGRKPRRPRTPALGSLGSPRAQRWTAVAALAAFLFVTLLTCWPALHAVYHGDDAGSESYPCVVTLLAKGQVLAGDFSPVVLPPPAVSFGEPVAPPAVCCAGDVRLSPTRAPPACSA
ncbi:MAG TPA: hypothetical protein PKM43_05400 [Verrucomicrobiota bacterium]|nr:hypothetical protein [Verrucomicrobiota bacterium]HRZ35970.1 hypothetical protein [Candidatus Paceibacterota bacterium]HRZ56437.1 hypothetical protein [Candidatus Paceibacterota bacterium]